jgi:hypothetical protein
VPFAARGAGTGLPAAPWPTPTRCSSRSPG